MKRSKPTNLGSNDKLIKSYKRFKSGVASHNLRLSNGDPRKEVSNPPDCQTADKTKKLLHGTRTPGKKDKSVVLKRHGVSFERKKGNLSADSQGAKALFKAAGDSTLTTTPNTVKKKRATRSSPIPVIMGLQCNSMTLTRTKKSKQLASKSPQNVGEPETPQAGVPLDKETHGDTSTKRKSGMTYKRQPKTRKISLALIPHNGSVSVKKLPNRRRIELTSQPEKFDKLVKGKRGRRRTINLNTESSPQDLQDSSKQKESGNSDINVEETLDTSSEDQPLSGWFLAILESAGKKLPEKFKLRKRNDQKPSFEKRSSFWETIESTEAFRLIPQNPHFRPLNNLKESARERHAIYKMVDFSGVFEELRRLRCDHPRTKIEDQLETLLELETHGFDVGPIRNRLMEMLSYKDKKEGFNTESKEYKDFAGDKRFETQERNKIIVLIDKQVDELLGKRERLANENIETELEAVAFEEKAARSKEAGRECHRKFDELATAPF